MKTIKIHLVFLLLMFCTHAFALSLREQLIQINGFWINHPLKDKVLDEHRAFNSDRECIQLHLQLVEKTLRAKNLPHLNSEQKKNRLQMLDVLHDYWVGGLFPKNTGHAVRTPYFIDVYGTACAVGQLIIKSGHTSVAKQIASENNNGYIFELVAKYSQIENWADSYGFSLEELAWIQPCYTPAPDTAGFRHPSCHNAFNGYFCPDLSQLQGPFIKGFYRWTDSSWVPWVDWCSLFLFNRLQAGIYKWEVKDGLNALHTYTAEMIAPAPAQVNISKSGDFKSCNGVITVSAQGGVLPYGYYWAGRTETTSVLNSVCEGLVQLNFLEHGFWCSQAIDIHLGPVGLQENTLNALRISPNPVSDFLQIRFDPIVNPKYKNAKVLNGLGQIILEEELQGELTSIKLNHLPPGLYFLQVDDYKVQRIVKE